MELMVAKALSSDLKKGMILLFRELSENPVQAEDMNDYIRTVGDLANTACRLDRSLLVAIASLIKGDS